METDNQKAERMWLESYDHPHSVVFDGLPNHYQVLVELIAQRKIRPTGRLEAGGTHPLYQTYRTRTEYRVAVRNRPSASGWTVTDASYPTEQEAQRVADELNPDGFDGFVCYAVVTVILPQLET